MNEIREDRWERQRRSFEQTAEAYDRFRPTYPDALFDDIRAYADLAPDDAILEIGCGTGRATVNVAAWGNPMIAIEPAAAMADIARRNVSGYPGVEVLAVRFEDDDPLTRVPFGLVLCAGAFHWLDAATRTDRIADALYHLGTAALVDNVQVNPAETLPFFVRVQDVYLEVAPDLAHKGEFRRPDDLPPHPLEGSARFVDLEERVHRWQWTLDTERYVGLMQTHSPHAALDPDVRSRLIAGIAEVIDGEFGGHVTEHYAARAALGRRA